jgi:hypothetical protein
VAMAARSRSADVVPRIDLLVEERVWHAGLDITKAGEQSLTR